MLKCVRCGTIAPNYIGMNFCPQCGKRYREKPKPTPESIAAYIEKNTPIPHGLAECLLEELRVIYEWGE